MTSINFIKSLLTSHSKCLSRVIQWEDDENYELGQVSSNVVLLLPVVLQIFANAKKIETFRNTSNFLLGNIVRGSVPEVALVGFGVILLIVEGRDQHTNTLQKIEQDQ